LIRAKIFMSIFPFCLFAFLLIFSFVDSAENSEGLAEIIESKVQTLVKLADKPEDWSEFERQVTNFAFSYSNLDEPNVPKLVYRELIKHPFGFRIEFSTVVSKNFCQSRQDSMRQITDAVIIRGYCQLMQDFSVNTLTEQHIELGRKLHDFILEIKCNSKVGTSHIKVVLKEFLESRSPEDIVLFVLFSRGPEDIYKYAYLVNKPFDTYTDFKFLSDQISFAIKFYEEYFNEVLKKLSNFRLEIKCSFKKFIFEPIMNLDSGTETFTKLDQVVDKFGKMYILNVFRYFPYQYMIAYFMILSRPEIVTISSSETQKFLEELKLLIYRPGKWSFSLPPNRYSHVIEFIQTNYLSQVPEVPADITILENLIWALQVENQPVLCKHLQKTG
jgi:hypothetical protein